MRRTTTKATPRPLPAALLDRLRAVVGDGAVITERVRRRAYDRDALSGHRSLPAVVVHPGSAGEVAGCVRACADAGVPFVARGAGTGLSGGALPRPDGVLLVLTRMRAIIDLDVANQRMTVEPGVTNAEISAAAASADLYYAPDPSSQVVCTIGGNVAENSGGAHCLKYGFTTHHVLGLELVTPQGEITWLGGATAEAPGYDLRGVVLGSEGTLGVVTKVVVRLLRRPETVRTVLAHFASPAAAGRAVTAVTATGIIPAAVEMMDNLAIRACEMDAKVGFDPDAGAVLVVELDGPAAEVAAELAAVERLCHDAGALDVRVARDEAERALIWKGRKAAFAAMGRLAPDYVVQDGVIPRTALGDVLARIDAMASEAGLRVANVFHAGDGNLHPLVLYDAARGETDAAEALAQRIIAACVEMGGSITGEHGVGVDKACAMPLMFGEEDLAVMARLRAAFDPDDRCNPGKVLPTPRLCGERPGPYRPHPLEAAGLAERL